MMVSICVWCSLYLFFTSPPPGHLANNQCLLDNFLPPHASIKWLIFFHCLLDMITYKSLCVIRWRDTSARRDSDEWEQERRICIARGKRLRRHWRPHMNTLYKIFLIFYKYNIISIFALREGKGLAPITAHIPMWQGLIFITNAHSPRSLKSKTAATMIGGPKIFGRTKEFNSVSKSVDSKLICPQKLPARMYTRILI